MITLFLKNIRKLLVAKVFYLWGSGSKQVSVFLNVLYYLFIYLFFNMEYSMSHYKTPVPNLISKPNLD